MGKTDPIRLSVCVFLMAGLSACQTTGSVRSTYNTGALSDILADSSSNYSSSEEDTPPVAQTYTDHQRPYIGTEFPMTMNSHVEKWITYFTGRGREWFQRALNRGAHIIPVIQNTLAHEGLPPDLVYLALIESGFSTKAYSRAHAVGPWQFIHATGKRYGLSRSTWVDERKDTIKSTYAAIAYLKDLYKIFHDWHLAAAGYNAGENKVSRAIVRYKTRDYWKLIKHRYLRPETRNYVPKIIAAATIAKNLDKYGFYIPDQEPYTHVTVTTDKPVSIKKLARHLKIDYEHLRVLNSELRSDFTPPNVKRYEIKVPPHLKETTQAVMRYAESSVPASKYATHYVHRGDSLWHISQRYGTTVALLMQINNMSNRQAHRLRPGQKIMVPVTPTYAKAQERKVASNTQAISRDTTQTTSASDTNKRVIHTVRRGDSLWQISKKYNISIQNLKRVNDIKRSRIFPGQKLFIPKA